MSECCRAEITDLHRFLEAWMTGALPRTTRSFERFAGVIADGFRIVSPRGVATERAGLLRQLEAAHGVHADAAKGFRIWIENACCRHSEGGLAVATYEEYQELSGSVTGRLSSALFRHRPGTPNGVEWLHLHETWLPDRAPGA